MSNAEHDTYLKGSPSGRSRARDLVIVASMALVAVAFGAALLVNGGFGLGPSIIGGLGLLVLTMFLHTMMRRLQALSRTETATSQESIALDTAAAPPGARPAATSASPAVGVEDDGEHGWGEPADVKNLVRHLATELQRPPSSAMPPGVAPASREPRIESARPMPTPARPLASERALSSTEPTPSRPAPSRAAAPPIAAAQEDILDIVRRAIDTEDIEIHLQPVMSLADRRTHLYEAFPRIRDGRGGLLKPEAYARTASETGLVSDIERVAFRRMVQILGRLIERGKQRPVFCPLSAGALSDGTFLRAFHETLRAGSAFAANLVFEMPESELGRLGPSERDAIHALANAGFRFSIQDVVQLDMESIGDLPIAFVKLLPIAISGQPGHAAGLVARIRSIGAEPVIDGVHDERDISVAKALGIVLGQGGFLSEPRPLKADVAGDTRTGT